MLAIKVNLRDGTVVGAEALVRWQHPERGLLPPHDFLPSIHDHPLGMELGEWVLDQALRQIGEWRRSGLHIPVSVNISAQQLLHGNFNDMLSALLNRHPDIPHDQLELEILEKSTHQDSRQVSEIMYQCLASGVEFSIDDFGSGDSSLSELKQLPARTLKIDQRLVSGMLVNADDLSIVSSIIGLATTFRRNVVAEGVETERHGARLLELGCSLAQGFCISAPMPAADLPAWIKHWNTAPLWPSPPQTVPKKTTRARRATTA